VGQLPIIDLYSLVLSLPVIILAFTVHEFAHAWAADRLGDPTARRMGRLTLEPWVHVDAIGLLMLMLYRFGWAKPVPVNPHNMRDPGKGMALTALAGPVSNIAMGAVFALLWSMRVPQLFGPALAPHVVAMLQAGLAINASLAVFNLLPLPPLDGSRIVSWLADTERLGWWQWLESYGPLVLMLVLVSGIGGMLIAGPADGLIGVLLSWAGHAARLFGIR
jgi:Zn-dependent protease